MKTRTFQLLYAREDNKKISQEARGSDGGEGEWGEGGRQHLFNRTSFKSLMVRFYNDSLMKFKVVEDEEKSVVPQNIHNKKIKQNGSH